MFGSQSTAEIPVMKGPILVNWATPTIFATFEQRFEPAAISISGKIPARPFSGHHHHTGRSRWQRRLC